MNQPALWTVAADDLTGAGDCAAAFAARGYASCIWLWGSPALFACAVQVFETSSRHVDGQEAYRRVCQVLAGIEGPVFKKVDSTLLGNLASELRAVRDATGTSRVILAPAHPAMGRVIRNGELLVQGQPCDPPRHLPTLEGVTNRDAATVEEIEAVAREALTGAEAVALAGSGALAEAIASLLTRREVVACPQPQAAHVAVVAGSTNPVTREQLRRLRNAGFHDILTVDRRDYGQRDLFLPLASSGALVIAGGDTARAVARHLGANGIRIYGEAARGVPWGTWIGGAAHGKPVATKAGGFGGAETLVEAVAFLSGHRFYGNP